MLYVDLNQVMISNIMMQIHSSPKMKLDENLIRHMVLNSLRGHIVSFKKTYGDVVICCDSSKSWRKEYFPQYKANRKKDREQMINVDWSLIFQTLNKLRDEFKTFFPYKVVSVEHAEADDIIAVLASNIPEKSLILSSDKDFVQLQKFPYIKQYSPVLKKHIDTDNPVKFLRELVLRGDRGDGVPNFLSSDTCFISEERQATLSSKNMSKWLVENPDEFCTTETMKRGFKRNQLMIDFEYIPENIQKSILEEYGKATKAKAGRLFDYFVENRLTNLLDRIQEFY